MMRSNRTKSPKEELTAVVSSAEEAAGEAGDTSPDTPGWSDLPPELLLLVLQEQLDWERDASQAIRSVCSAWRSIHDAAVAQVHANTWPAGLQRFPALNNLEVADCSALTDKALRHAVGNVSLRAVRHLSLSGCTKELTWHGIKALRRLAAPSNNAASLTSLHLGLSGLSARLSRELVRLQPALHSLRLDNVTLTEARVAELAKLSSLTTLTLHGVCDDDDEYDYDDEGGPLSLLLCQSTQLTTLRLIETCMDPWDLQAIGVLTGLHTLEIRGCDVDDWQEAEESTELTNVLTCLTCLTELTLSDVYLSFEDMTVLASRSTLTSLSLKGSSWFQDEDYEMDDSLVIALNGLPNLTRLDLTDGGRLMLESMEALRTHRKLTSLKLRNCTLTLDMESDDYFLPGLTALTELDLGGCGLLPMPCVNALRYSHKKLRRLTLDGNPKVSHCSCGCCQDPSYEYEGQEGDLLGAVLRKLTSLEQLELHNYTLSMRTVSALRALSSLTTLQLIKCELDKEEAACVGSADVVTAVLPSLPKLRTLALRGHCCAPRAADRAMHSLRSLSRLTELDLRGFGFLIDNQMRTLGQGLGALRVLHVECSKLATVVGVQAMVAKLPTLTTMHLRMQSLLGDAEVAALAGLVFSRLPTVLSSLTLQLGSCKLTDGGLLPLAAMPALREVTLVKADAADVAARVKVTDAGLSALRRAVRGVWPVFLKPGEPAPPPPLVVSRVCSSCL